jgi:hypothetical protein
MPMTMTTMTAFDASNGRSRSSQPGEAKVSAGGRGLMIYPTVGVSRECWAGTLLPPCSDGRRWFSLATGALPVLLVGKM